jgi:hypothetical protein
MGVAGGISGEKRGAHREGAVSRWLLFCSFHEHGVQQLEEATAQASGLIWTGHAKRASPAVINSSSGDHGVWVERRQ